MKKLLSILLLVPGLVLGQDILTKSYPGGVASFQSISALVNSNAEPLLSSAASAGATSIVLNFVPSNIVAGACFVAIDRFTTNCEIRSISSVSGSTLGVSSGSGAYALLYAHNAGAPVHFFDGNEPIPWTWMGAIPANTNVAVCSANVSGFNRLSSNLYNLVLRGPSEIFVPAGGWYINGELKPEREIGIRGANVMNAIIIAANEFVFTADGETAMIHAYRDGVAVEYVEPGVSGRWFINDLRLEGNFVTNSCGILSSPQQPDAWNNIRVDNCMGEYGIAIVDTQQHIMNNVELLYNRVGLMLRSASFVWVNGFNAERSQLHDIKAVTQPGGIDCHHVHFNGVHLEGLASGVNGTDLNPGTNINILSGHGWEFNNVWVSNQATNGTAFLFNVTTLTGYPVFHLRNVHNYQSFDTWRMVTDTPRGLSRTSLECNRYIHSIVSGGITPTYWAIELTGQNNAGLKDYPIKFPGGINLTTNHLGPFILAGEGSPEGTITGPVGSVWHRIDGGTNTTIYRKESGTGNTGWIANTTLTSGTWTPTLANAANLTASTAYQGQYYRVGNVVTASGRADVDPTLTGSTTLRISLPIASTISAVENVAGTAAANGIAGQSAAIRGDINTGTSCYMEWIAVDVSNQAMYFTFTYLIQ